ncbi:MAG: ABC transporter permease [Candidatus Promineifilaceae bacterium]|nr:ABC transporter permease [Candidatus Promineifilaceae bacterium]
MNESELIRILSSIMLQSAPLIIAVCGETITERVGIINLSLDGSMLMAAMTGFVVGLKSGSVWLGFLAGAAVGAFFALIVAFGSIRLRQSQVAIGFVLTLLGDDLSAFLGQNYTRIPGELVIRRGIPLLEEIPIVGPIFFDQDIVVYFSLVLVGLTWWFLNRTHPGLKLRGSGERPEAAFARGVDVNRLRYLYTMLGGALVGVAGAAYSLDIKIGWSEGHTRGFGWIALAIVIFGGWSPVRGAIGAVLFGATKALATFLQGAFPEVPVVLFNALPWVLMLAVLLIAGSNALERFIILAPSSARPSLRRLLRVRPPMALGTRFGEE